MKPTKPIDIDELKEMRKTHTIKQCAKHYGVSESLIEKRLSSPSMSVKTDKKNYPGLVLPNLGIPSNIDPNTALFFIQNENQALKSELTNTRDLLKQSERKVEEYKDEKLRLERALEKELEKAQTKPNALNGLMDGIGEGLKSDPAGTINAIKELVTSFIAPKTNQPNSQVSAIDLQGYNQQVADSVIGISNMLLQIYKNEGPDKFSQLIVALVALTQPSNLPILHQLQQSNQSQ